MPHSLHLQRWLPDPLYPALIWFSIFPHFGHRFHASSVLFLISSIIPLNLYFGHSRAAPSAEKAKGSVGSEEIPCPAKKPRRKAGIRAKQGISELAEMERFELSRAVTRLPHFEGNTAENICSYLCIMFYCAIGNRFLTEEIHVS